MLNVFLFFVQPPSSSPSLTTTVEINPTKRPYSFTCHICSILDTAHFLFTFTHTQDKSLMMITNKEKRSNGKMRNCFPWENNDIFPTFVHHSISHFHFIHCELNMINMQMMLCTVISIGFHGWWYQCFDAQTNYLQKEISHSKKLLKLVIFCFTFHFIINDQFNPAMHGLLLRDVYGDWSMDEWMLFI